MNRLLKKFRQDILGVALIGGGVFIALSLFTFNPTDPSFNSIGHTMKAMNACGFVGSFLADALYQLFGIVAWLLPISFVRWGVLSFQKEGLHWNRLKLIWGILLIISASCLIAVYWQTKLFQGQINTGGLVGLGVSQVLTHLLNPIGTQVLLWSALAILVVFFFEKPIQDLGQPALAGVSGLWGAFQKIEFSALFEKSPRSAKAEKPKKAKNDEAKKIESTDSPRLFPIDSKSAKTIEEDHEEEESAEPVQMEMDVPAPTPARRKVVMKTKVVRQIENWELPKLSLLEDPPSSRVRMDEKEIRRKGDLLKDKLLQFSVMGEVVAAKPGPAVTMFEFKPNANVRVSKITELADDLSLALSSESLRIIAPIPGRDVVGIETSNQHRETVYLKDLLAEENFWKEDMKLPIALGRQANGEPKIVDLRKMPHLMVAGTTGSGKSVFVVSLLTGLLFRHSPKTLRLILIDPKQVDLAAFDRVPHLAIPTVTDTRQAVSALKWAVREMEKRYKSMSRFGARGLEAFNEAVAKLDKEKMEEHEKINQELEATPGKKGEQYYYSPQPYIVIVVEEFGDLMSVDKNNVEAAVVRLAQMARACGIHLILAMQSPRKEVVTGLIKTNIPGRISFKVNSSMDSRIILDDTGAERLLAQGDMLFKSPGGSNLIRHHGPFLKDAEISSLAEFWSDQAEPQFDLAAMKAMESITAGSVSGDGMSGEVSEEDYDERYDEILAWAATQKMISASLIQRRFKLGYPRSARIVETFEREGVVGPASGSKARQVLIGNFSHLEE